jgi:hypothetical protein
MHGKKLLTASFKVGLSALALIFALTLTPLSFAGGFYISIERPPAGDEAFEGAVVLVRPYGCHQPEDAQMSGTAEGIVNGKRVSVPLQFTKTTKGVYAVKKQWDANGAWVLAISGLYNGHTSSALVELGAKGNLPNAFTSDGKGFTANTLQRKLTPADVDSALQKVSGKLAKAARS